MVGGLSWGHVGPSWGYVGLSWGQCGPIFGLCWAILGLCWPILELCWPILGLCWPILGLCWPILRPMLAHLEAYVGPCWPILNHKIRKMGKKGKSTKHRKTREFLAAGGAAPLSYGEERNAFGYATARGPLAGLFKRLRATAGQGPNYVGPFCGYAGLCWPILRAMWAHLVAMLASCWFMLGQKSRKMGTAKKIL